MIFLMRFLIWGLESLRCKK